MALTAARSTLGRIFFQRCFYLFMALLLLICTAPLIEPTPSGRMTLNAVNLVVVIAAVATVGLSAFSFVLAILLGASALGCQWFAEQAGQASMLPWSWAFGAGLYVATLVYLIGYVFRRHVITGDKLWGGAAAFLMIGALWAYLYAIVQYFYPGSFAIGGGGTPAQLGTAEFIYFSFTVLTSTGFGDLTPYSPQARSLCIVEQVAGALFVAILIARLAGVYPPRERDA